MATYADEIEQELLSWEGVTVVPHRFGGREFRIGRRELGHLHGSRLADLPFPVRVREELVAAGRVSPHHMLPDTGWVSFYLHQPEDVARAIALFRLNYDRPWLAPDATQDKTRPDVVLGQTAPSSQA